MEKLIELVKKHKELRPLMEIQDVYKLLYQSILGLGHLLENHQRAKKYLYDELDNLFDNNFEELLIEDISIKDNMVRINLRPFYEKKLSTELLFNAMLYTEKKNTATLNNLISIWNLFIDLVEKGDIDFNINELKDFNKKIIEMNYPIMHHSDIYNKNYKPAYRVIYRDVFQELFD